MNVQLKGVNISMDSMSEPDLLAWVGETDRTSDELDAACGRFVEVDKKIAANVSVSSKLLLILGSSKNDECRRLAIRHPKFPIGKEMKNLIKEFPEEFLKNPSLDRFLIEDPDLLHGCRALLDALNCPDELIYWFMKNGTLQDKQRIYINQIGSPEVRKIFKEDYFEKDFIEKVHALSTEPNNLIAKEFFKNHCKEFRKCAVPTFYPQDINNDSERIHDMIGGFPYTCEKYPWPQTDEGYYMQPIVQLDLDQASRILEEDYGSGLLQIWAPVFSSDEQRSESIFDISCGAIDKSYIIRLIPMRSISRRPTNFYPSNAPWIPSDQCRDQDVILVPALKLNTKIIRNPLIKWNKVSPMLKSHRDQTPYEKTILRDLLTIPEEILNKFTENHNSQEEYEKLYLYFDKLITQNFNTPERNIHIIDQPMIYIGGFGRAAEYDSEYINDGSPKNLPSLFSIVVSEDIGLTLTMDWLADIKMIGGVAGCVNLKLSDRKKGKLYLNVYDHSRREW